MKNILRKTLRAGYGLFWPAEQKWCDAARGRLLAEARGFLLAKGLISSGTDLAELGGKWDAYVRERFDPAAPEKFYADWVGEVGASNIIANVNDQFSRPYLAAMLTRHLAAGGRFDGTLLDFGCGTASLSVAWRDDFAPRCRLALSDVDNLAREFTASLAAVRPGVTVECAALEGVPGGAADAVVCVHVLEHVKDPVAVFRLIDRRLRPGGLLFLEAPWGGHREHIKEAPEGWTREGGPALLTGGYVMVSRMNRLIHRRGGISSVYRKRAA